MADETIIPVELDDWTKVEIGSWTSDKGNEFVTLRQMKRSKDGKWFAQKTKSGGFSALALRIEHWQTLGPRLFEFLQMHGASDAELDKMMSGKAQGGADACQDCGETDVQLKVLCESCLADRIRAEQEIVHNIEKEMEDKDDDF